MKKITNILSNGRCSEDRYIPDFNELAEVVKRLRAEGKKIILSSGVYDLIHVGHARYLELAKSNGGVLIVGVDSDALTKIRKGEDRPIVNQEERIEMLLHLRHVDIVTLYVPDSDNYQCIEAIKPDAIIISETTKDIKPEMLEQIEKHKIDKIMLPPQAEISSTSRIRDLAMTGGKDLAVALQETITNFLKNGGKK
jgi:D-beta-D-heptose 7-phosphate kinase/D-beta-D-heptose 1-phosphate adenosyltransferase